MYNEFIRYVVFSSQMKVLEGKKPTCEIFKQQVHFSLQLMLPCTLGIAHLQTVLISFYMVNAVCF